jgi:hypothetical protein
VPRPELFKKAVEIVNRRVWTEASLHPKLSGMGTTLRESPVIASAAGRDRETGSQKLLCSQAQATPMRISPAELEDSIQWLLLGGHAAEGLLALTALLALSYALSGGTQSEVHHAAVKLVLSHRHEPARARAVPGEEPH